MVKSKKRSNTAKRAVRPILVATKGRKRRTRGELSGDALAYKKVLLDPCNAALCKTPYEGADGAQISRGCNVINATTGFQAIAYHPVYGGFVLATADAQTNSSFSSINQLPYQSSGARAIAGCLSVQYSGAESARQGFVYCGLFPGSTVWQYTAASSGGAGGAFNIDTLVSRMVNVERMPVDKCEVNWFPGEGDSDYCIPTWGSSAQTGAMESAFSKVHFAVAVVYNGTTNVTFKAVNVVETSANTFTGFPALTIGAPIRPSFDWRAVLASIANKDTTWYLNTFKKMGHFIAGVSGSYLTAGLPGALGYLTANVAGSVNASRQRNRANR